MYAIWKMHRCDKCGSEFECLIEGFVPTDNGEVTYMTRQHSSKYHFGCGGEMIPLLNGERQILVGEASE